MKTLSPVQHRKTPHYILQMVISFAATVILTRYYLEWSGYPQIGSGDLHIAHLLWGGLAMFIGGLLPLIFANRGVNHWSAVLSGVGVGLFIDEVGKFITKTNDYFYPAAAPIIYGVFLLTVLLYIEIRRRQDNSPRTRFYAVLDQLPVVIDQEITREELTQLKDELEQIAGQKDNPVLAQLSEKILSFFGSEHLQIVQRTPSWMERLRGRLRAWWEKLIGRRIERLLLALGLGLPGFVSLIEVLLLLVLVLFPAQAAELWAQIVFSSSELSGLSDLRWLTIRLFLDSLAGLLAISSAILLLIGKDRRGVSLGMISLVLALTVNNLLIFYMDQFKALTFTLIQGGVYLLLMDYRRRFLNDDSSELGKG